MAICKVEIYKKQAQKTSGFQLKQAQKQTTRKSSKHPQLHKKTSPNLRENCKAGNTNPNTTYSQSYYKDKLCRS